MNLPNQYPTAENTREVSGVHSTQRPESMSSCSSKAILSPTDSNRMFGLADAAISASQSVVGSSRHSMFDCPLQSHTSPTTTFVKRTVSARPVTVISRGVVSAAMAGSVASQRPVRSACTETSDPAKRTVTDSPFTDRPHMRIGRSRCKTMLSLKNLGIDTSACVVCHVTRKAKSVKTKLFIVAFSFIPQFSRQTHLRVRDARSGVSRCRCGCSRACNPRPCGRRSRRRGRSSPRP